MEAEIMGDLYFTVGRVYYWKRRRKDKTNKVRIWYASTLPVDAGSVINISTDICKWLDVLVFSDKDDKP